MNLETALPRIRSLFAQRASFQTILNEITSCNEWYTYDSQDKLFREAIHPFVDFQRPPPKRWLHLLIKELQNLIEIEQNRTIDCDCELVDGFFNIMIENQNRNIDDIEEYFSFFSFEIDDNGQKVNFNRALDYFLIPMNIKIPSSLESFCSNMISIRSFRAHNQVGTRPWEAGYFLAEILLSCSKDALKGKTIVELGAGIGMTGLVLSKCFQETTFVLTDFAKDVVENLSFNCKLNVSDFGKDNCKVQVKTIDWCFVDDVVVGDIILAADCSYSPDINLPLIRTIKDMIIQNNQCKGTFNSYALVASTLRNQDTWDHFQSCLAKECDASHAFAYENISESIRNSGLNRIYHYENRDSISIIKIYQLEP